MFYGDPRINNGDGIYNGGGGGFTLDLLKYFDIAPVYWDSANNPFSPVYIGNLSNENLRIKGTFYSPNGALRGSLFRICNGNYANRDITVQYQNSTTYYLNNGDYGVYPGTIDLIGLYEIDIYRDSFKLNTNSYVGNYTQVTKDYIFPLPLSVSNNPYSESNKSALINLKLIDEQTNSILFDFYGAKRKRDNQPCIIEVATCISVYNYNGFLKNYAMP